MRPLQYSHSSVASSTAKWNPSQEEKDLMARYIAVEALLRPKKEPNSPKEETAKPKKNAALERFLSRNMGSVKKIIN